jgi:dUTP pyrophosphatase
MQAITVKVMNRSSNPLPAYATEGASGMDIRAELSEPIRLEPLQRVAVPTGIHLEIPTGFEVQVRPRSGLAINQGITCLNTPGTVDSDYRGEVKVILINLSAESQIISHGDRIAQLVVQRVERAVFEQVENLGSTLRDQGGFGHTGSH